MKSLYLLFLLFSLGMCCPDLSNVVNTTNKYRALHQAIPLTWDKNLSLASTEYAKILSKNCALEHSGSGENLYSVASYPAPNDNCQPAIDVWYSEASRYKYTNTPFTDNWKNGVGHFTQLVWKGTKKFGCGYAISDFKVPWFRFPIKCKVIVCRYLPFGNVGSDSAFKQNVLPIKNYLKIEL